MVEEEHYFCFTYEELRVIMVRLVHCKNKLMLEGRCTDCGDEMILNISRLM